MRQRAVQQQSTAAGALLNVCRIVYRGWLALRWGPLMHLRGVRDEVLSDQLSDYEVEDRYTTAHVHTRSSRAAGDIGRASGMLHTEEVTGSNPVSPTVHKALLTT
jgi:hypothetical protein